MNAAASYPGVLRAARCTARAVIALGVLLLMAAVWGNDLAWSLALWRIALAVVALSVVGGIAVILASAAAKRRARSWRNEGDG